MTKVLLISTLERKKFSFRILYLFGDYFPEMDQKNFEKLMADWIQQNISSFLPMLLFQLREENVRKPNLYMTDIQSTTPKQSNSGLLNMTKLTLYRGLEILGT